MPSRSTYHHSASAVNAMIATSRLKRPPTVQANRARALRPSRSPACRTATSLNATPLERVKKLSPLAAGQRASDASACGIRFMPALAIGYDASEMVEVSASGV